MTAIQLPNVVQGIPAYKRMDNSVTRSIPNAAWTALDVDSIYEVNDPNGYITWDATNKYLVINRAGLYIAWGDVINWQAAGASTRRGIRIMHNGNNAAQITTATATLNVSPTAVSAPILAVVGSTVQMQVYQDNGTALNVVASTPGAPSYLALMGIVLT